MSAFVEWNSLLLAKFFTPAAKDEEVWLQATRIELDSIGLRLGGAEGLIAAVQVGPPWLSNYHNIAEAAGRLARQRTIGIRSQEYLDPGEVDDVYSGFSAPTYLPYLALWVLASSDSENGFYASVERMSSRPFPATSNSIREEMLGVWSDLERWTLECDGNFGIFEVRVLGNHRFVGIPRSQCLISSKDKKGLPHLFWECRLRPRQNFDDQTYKQVSSIAAKAYYLSNGLRDAFVDPTYSEPLKHMLIAAFQLWDGKAPRIRPGDSAGQGQRGESYDDATHDVTLVLRPAQSAEVDWEIHWRIPLFSDTGKFDLSVGGGKWSALIEEAGTHASTIDANYQTEARQVLARAKDSDIEFTVTYIEGGDENGVGTRSLLLPRRTFRTLAWDVPDPSLGNELIEGEIPLYGPCYLLFDKGKEGFFERLLGPSRARWQTFDARGLPERWRLGVIHHCDLLSTYERIAISENPEADHEIARIRLVGGRPLVRGGGRTYAFYDLPIIELEAPDNANLVAEGLELTRLGGSLLPGIDRPHKPGNRDIPPPVTSGIRRYALRITDERKALFQISVVAGGNTVATTMLKVSVAGGKGAAQGRNFGLSPLGQALASGNRLLGILRGEDGLAIPGRQLSSFFTADKYNWRVLEAERDLRVITESVPARFLDSLAQLGSVAYGTARDQLLRLAHQAQIKIQPPLMLLELRGRGYLEIETDNEGHMIRVHAVPPTLYSLPIQYESKAVRGVCGTLRLQHWNDLGDHLVGVALIDATQHPSLPVLWLVPGSENDYRVFIEEAGFADAQMPSSAIADWASGITEARQELGAWGWATLATDIRHLQRFQPNGAEFFPQDSARLDVDPLVMASLYRFEDPTIQGLQVYVLGIARPDGQRKYSFLQDSRWGIWLALSAFAEFAKRVYEIGDAVPWPIHYSARDGTVWLPARLRPPFVIERVLMLCSGSAPKPVTVMPDSISPVYTGMANGVWLAYPWVPEDIARKVAELLGATLAPL